MGLIGRKDFWYWLDGWSAIGPGIDYRCNNQKVVLFW